MLGFSPIASQPISAIESQTSPQIEDAPAISGGYFEVPQVPRRRSIKEDRELLGIIPKQIKKVIQQVAIDSLKKQKTETQAVNLLQSALSKQDIQPTNQYAELMRIERDRILERDIKLALMLRAKWEADEADENMAIELLLL